MIAQSSSLFSSYAILMSDVRGFPNGSFPTGDPKAAALYISTIGSLAASLRSYSAYNHSGMSMQNEIPLSALRALRMPFSTGWGRPPHFGEVA